MSELFDWEKCILCQRTQKGLKTTCPAFSKRSDVGSGYKSLAEKIQQFLKCEQLPPEINMRSLDEGDGVEATCSRHKAFWHRKCISQTIHTTTLNRMLKQSTDLPEPLSDSQSEYEVPCKKRNTRGSSGSVCVQFTPLCFFCEKEGSDLRQVLTQKVDAGVRECATLLEDSMLLGKFVHGDMIATEAKYHPGCLLALYEKASKVQKTQAFERNESHLELQADSLALAEVIAYIEGSKLYEATPSVFIYMSKHYSVCYRGSLLLIKQIIQGGCLFTFVICCN
jgi:hypothetical protein